MKITPGGGVPDHKTTGRFGNRRCRGRSGRRLRNSECSCGKRRREDGFVCAYPDFTQKVSIRPTSVLSENIGMDGMEEYAITNDFVKKADGLWSLIDTVRQK